MFNELRRGSSFSLVRTATHENSGMTGGAQAQRKVYRMQRLRERCSRASTRAQPVVQHYTEVLMLPFRVQLKRDAALHSATASPDPTSLKLMASAFASAEANTHWKRVTKASIKAVPTHRDGTIDKQWDRWQHYAAAAYFHPTVRSFLFGSYHHVEQDGDVVNDYLQVFQHKTLAALSVDLTYGRNENKHVRTFSFDVVRCHVALLQPDVGVLQLELRAGVGEDENWALADMQKVRDQLRHLFPPYFKMRRKAVTFRLRCVCTKRASTGLFLTARERQRSEREVSLPILQILRSGLMTCHSMRPRRRVPTTGNFCWPRCCTLRILM